MLVLVAMIILYACNVLSVKVFERSNNMTIRVWDGRNAP
jgi:hypothetical protein